jgi:hypothetical protein
LSTEKQQRGLLAHSSKAADERKRFMALQHDQQEKVGDGEQMKNFLLYSRAGITTGFCFAALIFISGLTG